MDIYSLLQEENQRFWDFLEIDNTNLDPSEVALQYDENSDSIEEVEFV